MNTFPSSTLNGHIEVEKMIDPRAHMQTMKERSMKGYGANEYKLIRRRETSSYHFS